MAAPARPHARATCVIVNGPSSAGKSTLCAALQDALTLAYADAATAAPGSEVNSRPSAAGAGNAAAAAGGAGRATSEPSSQDTDHVKPTPTRLWAKVGFDDFLHALSPRLHPRSFAGLVGADVGALVSRAPHDGRAAWEYVAVGGDDGESGDGGVRLVFSEPAARLLRGQTEGWGCMLQGGTSLVVDAFLQDREWADDLTAAVARSGALLLLVCATCDTAELERREVARGDRPRGLARCSAAACHGHGLTYDVEVRTDTEPTATSVERIVAAVRLLEAGDGRGGDAEAQAGHAAPATSLAAPTAPSPSNTALQQPPERPLTHCTATELIPLLRSGTVSAAGLLEMFLSRVDGRNPAVNAVVVLDAAAARARAAELDAARARGDPLGPLHGLPMTIKNHPPARLPMGPHSELLVTQLTDAGAVIFGYTNVPTGAADWQTYNETYGTTRNPWDPERTPGGSSGGSAAALASALTPVEVGSDVGGSIRVPAAHCGLFGHKPTFGVVPGRGTHGLRTEHPIGPERDLSVRGPMARTASDLALLMDVIAAPAPLVQHYWALRLPRPTKHTLSQHRVAVWGEQDGYPVCAEVRAAVDAVVDALRRHGAQVDVGRRPDFDPHESHRLYLQLLGCSNTAKEPFSIGREWEAHNLTPEAEARLAAVGGRLWQVEDNAFVAQHSVTQTRRQHHAANERRSALRAKWAEFFRGDDDDDGDGGGGGGYDAVLMPVYPVPAIRHLHEHRDLLYPHTIYGPYWRPTTRRIDVDGEAVPYEDAVFWSGVPTVCYLPSTAFPAGLGAASGLPVGLQLVGPEGGDHLTIALAGLLETEAGFASALPPGV